MCVGQENCYGDRLQWDEKGGACATDGNEKAATGKFLSVPANKLSGGGVLVTSFISGFRTTWTRMVIFTSRLLYMQVMLTRRGAVGGRYELTRPGGPERGPGPDQVAFIFVFLGSIIICRPYKLILPDQAGVNSATESSE